MAKVSHCFKKKKEAIDQEHGARCGNVTSKANSCHSLPLLFHNYLLISLNTGKF